MVKDDYLSSTTGGSLRLKGAKDAGITKKKKKKSKPTSSSDERAGSAERKLTGEGEGVREPRKERPGNTISEEATVAKERAVNPLQEADVEEEAPGPHVHKTEAERRHEEMRRKRVRRWFRHACTFSLFHALGPNPQYER